MLLSNSVLAHHRVMLVRSIVIVASFLVALPGLTAQPPTPGELTPDTARMLMDVSLNPASSQISGLTPVGATVLFLLKDDVGITLWRSDGTEAGTAPVRRIRNGPGLGGEELETLAVGETLYFTFDDGVRSQSLWRSDGTEAGTYPLRQVFPSAADWYSVYGLISFRGQLVFIGQSAKSGLDELWRTDGTGAGTLQIVDITRYEGYALKDTMAVVDDTLYFIATKAPMGRQLWRTDGTEAGSVLIRDFTQTSVHMSVGSMAAHGGALYLSVSDPVANRFELWHSDGTAAGTVPVIDLAALDGGFTADLLASAQGWLFMSVLGSGGGWTVWRSDGTQQGTTALASGVSVNALQRPGKLIEAGLRVYFTGVDDTGTMRLWRSDGTQAGSAPVLALDSLDTVRSGLAPNGEQLLVSAADARGQELWAVGPEGAATLVRDILPGPAGSTPSWLATLGGSTFFSADEGIHGRELWASDGTTEGTALVRDLSPGTLGSDPEDLTVAGGRVFFTADDGVHGRELWAGDGTTEGTALLVDINPGAAPSTPQNIVGTGGRVFFTADDGAHGREVWTSDGTPGGTVLLAELTPGAAGSNLRILLTPVGSRVFFVQGIPGEFLYTSYILWVSDGTPAGTRPVKNLWPKRVGFTAALDGRLIFSVDDVYGGIIRNSGLWSSDGTPDGTGVYYDGPGTEGWSGMERTSDGLYLTIGGRNMSGPLWRSDGTAAGTQLLRYYDTNTWLTDAAELPGSALLRLGGYGDPRLVRVAVGEIVEEVLLPVGMPSPMWLTRAGDSVFLNTPDAEHGVELWLSDGSAAGTKLVRDICPGQASSEPHDAQDIGGRLLFVADDCAAGRELWLSDGSASGTRLVAEIRPGAPGSHPGDLVRLGDLVIFVADDGVHGRELWALPLGPLTRDSIISLPLVAR